MKLGIIFHFKIAFDELLNQEDLNDDLSNFLKSSDGLWQFQNVDNEKLQNQIQQSNQNLSLEYPHCSICLLFKQHEISAEEKVEKKSDAKNLKSNKQSKQFPHKLPVNSEIILSEMSFSKKYRNKSRLPSLTEFRCEKIDCLLQCKNCKLTVHQSM